MSRLFFIVGRGRSGTTLLGRMLDAHPSVAVSLESTFILTLFRRYGKGGFDAERRRRFCRDLWLESRMHAWRLDRDRTVEDLLALPHGVTFPQMCEAVYASAARQRGHPANLWLGDKNPIHSLFLPTLRGLFPAAPILHISRDPRDNVASFMAAPFDANHPEVLAQRWRAYHEAVLDEPAVHHLRYEDLVANPEDTLQGVCGHLGIAFHEQMLTFFDNPKAQEHDWMPSLRGPVHRSRIGVWKRELNPRDAAAIEEICAATMRRLGYRSDVNVGPGSPLPKIAASVYTGLERRAFSWPAAPRQLVVDAYRRHTGNRAIVPR